MSVTRTVVTAVTGAGLALAAGACSGAAGEATHHHTGASAGPSQEGLGTEHRAASPLGHQVRQQLAAAKQATAPYHEPQRAEADGYGLPPAPAPLHECITAMDGHGAMGLHFINGANLDATLDAASPEAVIYEPDAAGRLRLVAVEYVVFEDAWKKAGHGGETPRLFGRDLTYVGDGNAYEIPAFYQIHAWVWKNNPDGMFADHNPTVSCSLGTAHHGATPS